MSDTPRPNYSYEGLLRHLSGGRNKNDRPTNVHCLRVVRVGGEPAIKMYRTNIALFHKDGTITLNVGSYEDSMCTRQRVGEVTGASITTIAQHKKRSTKQTTRIYAGGRFPNGLPYANGCVVRRGIVIEHPWTREQKVASLEELTEEILVPNKEKAKTYYAARRALVKRMRPMYGFIDARALEGVRDPHHVLDWFEDVLFTPPTDEDIYHTLRQLVALGCPSLFDTWKAAPTFGPDDVANYVQRGMTKCAGPSSWDILDHLKMIDTVRVRCCEV